MIGITRLLCGVKTFGDSLRYGGDGSSPRGRGPVVVWNLTQRCNLHCLHCYSDSKDRDYPGELTTAEGLDFLDSLASFKVPVVLFSGGEPLLREDLFLLARRAVERGIRAVISTNGTLITRLVAREAKEAGVSYVGVSLDGLEGTNDKFRGKKGAFGESLEGLRHCREAGIKAGLRFTLTRYNQDQIGGIFDLLEEEGIPRLCFYHLVYSGRGSNLIEEDLTHEETRRAVDLIFARTLDFHRRGMTKEVLTVDNYADGVYLYLKVRREEPERAKEVHRLLLRNGGNSSGVGIAAVDSLGNVHADQFWRHYSFGNIRQRRFGDIWEDTSDPLMRGLKDRGALIKGRCALCHQFPLCKGNLRVRAEAIFGDVWAEDPACYLSDQEIGVA